MRLGLLAAQRDNGDWETLALPDVPIDTQRELLKTLIVQKGRLGGGKKEARYVEALLMTTGGHVRRRRFHASPEPVV